MTALDPSAILARLTAEVQAHAAAGRTPPASLIAVILDLRRQLEVMARHREAHPLAYARLWAPECAVCPHPDPAAVAPPKARRGQPMTAIPGAGLSHRCPTCGIVEQRTSQIALAQAALDGDYEQVFALGGNRTGKTELGAQLTAAQAMGADHPDVIAWAALNGLSLGRLLPGPGIVWAVSQTFSMSRTVQRGKLDKYLPAGSKRRNWDAESEAEVRLPGGGKIVLKAASMAGSSTNAKNPFEGANIRFAWVDEEIQSPIGYESIKARTTDDDGMVFVSMTPLSGWTPFLMEQLKHIDKGTPCPPRLFVGFLHAIDNPHVSAEVVKGKWANAPEAIRRARLRGEIVPLEGAVHPTFTEGLPYVVPAFDPPASWTRYGSIDFGSRAPFCHLWAAHDESNDVLHIFGEYYEANRTIKEHAEALWRVNACPDCYTDAPIGSDAWQAWSYRQMSGATGCQTCGGSGLSPFAPEFVIADPEDLGARNTLASEYNIPNSPANKDAKRTWDRLLTRMAIHPTLGTPAVVIHDCCANLIRETRRLTWRGGKAVDLKTEGDDHAHDCLRYLCGYLPPPHGADEAAEAAK